MEQTLIRLRDDALARGMDELAIVYGWSLIRIKGERVIASVPALRWVPGQFKRMSGWNPNG